ncbi:serine hydrolase domain-containing protein [Saccharothrix sp. ST-888]|uniref:serine hydrolase domain-containing protein n=1 Tax=Saccharothrix sp. ST-888 TaxID=1427391 RepID=UPI000B152917|nr:serine hydrolase domain-containing protein [Saccharothrix sp. ST-888]
MYEHAPNRVRSLRHRQGGRRRTVSTALAVAVGAMTIGVLAPPFATAASRPDGVQQSLNALVRDDGMPAVLATAKGRDGRTHTYTAGVADLVTKAKVPVDGQVRIGSNTKTFTAVVVLQLVGEQKIGLDATIDTYLPGLLRGDGIDGRRIAVRQLLQHISGLPDYMASPQLTDFAAVQYRYFDPRDFIDMALAREADFSPGAKWEYGNTNYLVAGLIIQKVTGDDAPVLGTVLGFELATMFGSHLQDLRLESFDPEAAPTVALSPRTSPAPRAMSAPSTCRPGLPEAGQSGPPI